MEFNLNAVMEKEMKNFTTNVVKEAVKALSVEYGFKAEEALEKMNLEEVRMRVGVKVEKNKKAKEETPSIPLPFTGQIKEGWCQAIKQNHGLYSQCNNTAVTEGDVVLCKACNNQKEKKGKPTCGYIQERMEGPLMEYKDDKGKQVVTYGVVLKKLQIERADAEAEAMKYGIMIPEDQYEIPEKTKGRPKKEDEADKKRGRPKKEKKVVSGSAADDLVAKLISEANKAKSANAADTLLASLVAEAQAVKNVVTVEAIPLAVGGKGAAPPEESEAIPLAVGGKGAVPSEEKAAIPLAVGGKGAVPPEEKAAKKAQQEKEKAEKKAQQEEEKVAKKAQQEQEKKEKKAQQDAEKAVLKAQQEQEKKEKAEQAKIAKKAQQEQEKADKKAAAKGAAPPEQEKADKKAAPPKKTPEKAAPPELEHEAEEDEKENSLEVAAPPEEATISVKKFEFEGQVYLRSSDDVLYNIETQEPVGMWNEDDKCIDEIEVEED